MRRNTMKWLCCQLGAREQYAIPRALLRADLLECLVTDAWVSPSSFLSKFCGSRSKLRYRFHKELRDARVKAFNSSLLLFEAVASTRGLAGWPKIIARNRWFQRQIISFLNTQHSILNTEPTLLSYSYTALEPFRYAKAHGWKTLLVQIDPGPAEEAIVAEEVARVPELAGTWQRAPPEYWNEWREECNVADRIVVNSEWSRDGLIRGGVPREKVSIIPLAYETPAAFDEAQAASDARCARKYPARFTQERPLRVLFLGQINLRKGVARLLEAARILRDDPVEFWMAGPVEIAMRDANRNAGRIKWLGPVKRQQAAEFYRGADVFILPTLSDGFAITQLEAQAQRLPIIASKFCGAVVQDGLDGIVLEQPNARCIAGTLRDCIANPGRLQEFAAASGMRGEFTIDVLAQRLQNVGTTP